MNLQKKLSKICHPTLRCANSHQVTDICVNVTCKANSALFCQDCSGPHQDCGHLTLKQFTRSLQKCEQYELSLKSQIKKIYEEIFQNLKNAIDREQQTSQLPIGSLEADEERILTSIYLKNQFVEFSSETANQLNEKIIGFKAQSQKKLSLLKENFRKEMSQFANQIIELHTTTFQQFKEGMEGGLSQRSRRKLQLQKLKQNQRDVKVKQKEMHGRKFEAMLEQINQADESDKLAELKRQYEHKIAFLEQKIKDQDAIFQELRANNHTFPDHSFITNKLKPQTMEVEERYEAQPQRIKDNEKLSIYYAQLDKLRSRNEKNELLLDIYERIADQLRQMLKFKESNYYYQQARKLCQRRSMQDSKSQAYQIFWMASNYSSLLNYQKSLQLFQLALKLYEKGGRSNDRKIASTLSSIGYVYCKLHNFKESISYNMKAGDLLRKRSDKESQINIAANIKNVGECYYYIQQLALAQKYLLQSLQLLQGEQLRQIILQGQCYKLLCQVKFENKEYQSAFKYLAIYISKAINSQGQLQPFEGKFFDQFHNYFESESSQSMKKTLLQILKSYRQHIQEMEVVLKYTVIADQDGINKE